MPRVILSSLLIFIGLNVSFIHAQTLQNTPPNEFANFDIPNIAGEIKIDGELDESQWQQAEQVELNFVTRPYENTRPPVTTKVRVFENGDTLYVAFKAQDPAVKDINAFYRDRDGIWNNDIVGVKLDTFNDSRLAYQFFVNPYGIQADAIQNEMTGNESDSWD